MNTPFTKQHCVPCEGGTTPLTHSEFGPFLDQIPKWSALDNLKLEKTFSFKNFGEALSFVNKVGKIAEKEGHHPDINLHNWRKVTISLTTHSIKGLSWNDFVVAAKIDKLV